jgi:glucose-1-phosphate cytidylyltransferase
MIFEPGLWNISNSVAEPWRVSFDTGLNTMTGGRLKRVGAFIGDESFMLTDSDGVADVDILAAHGRHGQAATVTAVQPPPGFGSLEIDEDGFISSFREKPGGELGWINGGFFVLQRSVLDLIEGDDTVWEREPLDKLAAGDEFVAHRHTGFWQPVDLREKNLLESLWAKAWRTRN